MNVSLNLLHVIVLSSNKTVWTFKWPCFTAISVANITIMDGHITTVKVYEWVSVRIMVY